MRNTPLFPRPWPRPLTSAGVANSRWSWQSPNLSLVLMSPLFGMAYPSLTIHFSPPAHFDRSLPSNNTTASDGGLLSVPGVTTAGSGQTMPDLYSTRGAGSFFVGCPLDSCRRTRTAETLPALTSEQRSRVRRDFIAVRTVG